MIIKTVLLTILILVNLFLLGVMIYPIKRTKDTTSRTGFVFLMTVILLDMVFMIGGATLW